MLHLHVPETILRVEDIKQSPDPQRTKQMKERDRQRDKSISDRAKL